MALMNPHPVEHIPVALVLMGLSGVLEGGSLVVAYRQVKENAAKAGIPFMQYVRAGPDPNDVAVLVEDTVAVTGVGIAGACLGLTWYCNNPMYDALGMPIVMNISHLDSPASLLMNYCSRGCTRSVMRSVLSKAWLIHPFRTVLNVILPRRLTRICHVPRRL